MEKLKLILKLIRIEQWLKNLFIFLPLFFSQEFTSLQKVVVSLVVFLGFSLIASSIYCFNDLNDIEQDKIHPKKKKRPLASGKLTRKEGIIIMLFCLVLGIVTLYFSGSANQITVIAIALFYFFINILYTIRLKNISIIDVMIIAAGFVIRILIGGFAVDVPLTHWIIIMTFLVALFIAFAKRRDDYMIYKDSGTVPRKNIMQYNVEFLNSALVITATIAIVSYIMYTVSPDVITRMNSEYVYATSVFVLAGIFRYLQITFVKGMSGSPTYILIKDRFIQLCIACWLITFIIIMYA